MNWDISTWSRTPCNPSTAGIPIASFWRSSRGVHTSELRQSWRVLLLDLEGVDDREIRGKLQWIVSVYLGDVALT